MACVFWMLALPADAEDAGAVTAPADRSTEALPDPRTSRIEALLSGSLDVAVAPEDLFDVPIHDEAAVQVEAARVRALLEAVEHAPGPARAQSRRAPGTRAARDETPPAGPPEGPVDPALWNQRLALDRSRLQFYAQSAERRAELLQQHRARQEAVGPPESEERQRIAEAEAEQARTLAEARAARSEAERLVSEELARLGVLDGVVRDVRGQLEDARETIVRRRDIVFGWQRRIRDAKRQGPIGADTIYDALRRALRSGRDDLSLALDALGSGVSAVPRLGVDPLVDIPPDVPTEQVRTRRVALVHAMAVARNEERAVREEDASALLDEIHTLNRERLELLSALSAQKRSAITGFTSQGWDQARSEARQLSLVLRYHLHVARTWLRSLRSGAAGSVFGWRTTAAILPMLLAAIAFLWVRRRSESSLQWADARLAAADRAERRTTPSPGRRAVRILLRAHRPLEWLALFELSQWLLPEGARNLLEVELLSSALRFSLIGALVVHTINAFAAGASTTLVPFEEGVAGQLRFRSLRLVGRTVVVFALILVLSARLVGEGTIHRWVFSTCWFAAIPVFLLIVRWWRGTVFERLDRVRKKTPIEAWILASRSGWKSFAAATLGAVLLFFTGAVKVVRAWLSSFDLARRAHAYLFKREIERIGSAQVHTKLAPLPTETLLQLHPEEPHTRWLPCPADSVRAALLAHSATRHGGLIAIVGARGMGKSSILRDVAASAERTLVIRCDDQTTVAVLEAAFRCGADSAVEASAPRLVLVDDAHTLVAPRIGGFVRFDEALDFARKESGGTTWVFSFDASLWPLLKRARDARPMFDEIFVLAPWNERQIGDLLADRSERASVTPRFDDLLDRLPTSADEIDRQDALRAKRAGYERMLWDHVGGNPGLALEVWRSSLGEDEAGAVHVRRLQVPDMAKLERLPDASLFVLRAVLQLAPTTVEAVAQATRLRPEEVLRDIRFGLAHGFYDDDTTRLRVAWPWLRSATRLLERRHLLVIP